MGIGVSGLISGLDTESIIGKLMELERRPIVLLQKREAEFQAKISAMGTLKGALSDFQGAVTALKESDVFFSFKAVSGSDDVISVTDSAEALAGRYNVTVSGMAQAQQLRSSAFTGSDQTVGTGTMTLQVGSDAEVEIAIDSDHQTLTGIADAINEADAGVTAAVIHDGSGNYYLTLVSGKTGSDNTISFSVDDDDGNNNDSSGLSGLYTDPAAGTLAETQEGKNAQLTVNGIQVERAENTITDLIQGVTMTINKVSSETVTVNVSQDTAAITGRLRSFVEKFNGLMETLDKLQAYDPETEAAGSLMGDGAARQVQSRLKRLIYAQVEDVAGEVNSFSSLGVEMDRYGKLSLDAGKFTEALENHQEDVISFFTRDDDGNKGIAVRFDELLDGYLQSTTGVISSREEGLKSSIERIEDQMERINLRLSMREENLRYQFEALEMLLSDFQITSGQLEQQLTAIANLNASISKGK